MLRTAWATSSSGAVAALLLTTKGGVLCRPTVSSSVQQPGRERPRSLRAKMAHAPSGVAHAPVDHVAITGGFRGNFIVDCARKSGSESLLQEVGQPSLRPFILRECLGASRLPSLRSALRGLDPPRALPVLAFTGATRVNYCRPRFVDRQSIIMTGRTRPRAMSVLTSD